MANCGMSPSLVLRGRRCWFTSLSVVVLHAGYRGDGDLPPPLPDLHHQREARARQGTFRSVKAPVASVSAMTSGSPVVVLPQRSQVTPAVKGFDLAVGHVDQGVVERHLTAGIEDRTHEGGGAAAVQVTCAHWRLTQVGPASGGGGGKPPSGRRRQRRPHRGAGARDADLLQAAVDGAGAARRRADVVLAAGRAAARSPRCLAGVTDRRADGLAMQLLPASQSPEREHCGSEHARSRQTARAAGAVGRLRTACRRDRNIRHGDES